MKAKTTPLQEFGIKVKKARKNAKISQKELGQKVGISNEWVCKIETGKATVISMTLMAKISDALEMNITWTVVEMSNPSKEFDVSY